MKLRIAIIGLLLLVFSISYSQTVNDVSKISLGVRFLDNISQETINLQPQLEDRLTMFATQSGYSSYGNNTFFISPNIIINSIDIAEGGMKNVYVVQGELYLTIQDGVNGTVYSSTSYPFKGSATKKEMAIKNAILNIKYNGIQGLFDDAKRKILSYYMQQQNIIFARAETCAKIGNYDEAITCLMMIPEELTELHVQALRKSQDIYEQRDEAIRQQMIEETLNNNESILAEANSLLAMHNPQNALKILWDYRSCDKNQDSQYATLVRKAEKLISDSEKEVLRKEERAYQDNKQREMKAWKEYTTETAHRRDMDMRSTRLKSQIVSSEERIAHHLANVDAQKINALKTIACEYLRNNPNVDYIHVKY